MTEIYSIFPKKKVIKLYIEKYQETYGNRSYVPSKDYIKDTRISRLY